MSVHGRRRSCTLSPEAYLEMPCGRRVTWPQRPASETADPSRSFARAAARMLNEELDEKVAAAALRLNHLTDGADRAATASRLRALAKAWETPEELLKLLSQSFLVADPPDETATTTSMARQDRRMELV